jgi:hypothetical protein
MEKTEMELKILREKKVNGIITRAKAKWQVEGEKSTRYFCNLEKRHYLHLTTSSLVGFVINGLLLLKKRSTWDLLIIGSVLEYNCL